MLDDILFALWFFIPAGAANAAPIFVARMPWFSKFDMPMDFGKELRGRRIFGAHKTWRGLISGMTAGILVLWLQQLLAAHTGWAHHFTGTVDYAALPTILAGALFGFGALGGDAIKSFFKRQVGVAPGRSWFPFDQLDYIIGGAIATLPFVSLTLWQYLWIFVIWLGAHLLASYVGFMLHLKERPI